jgi:hypothetical protein
VTEKPHLMSPKVLGALSATLGVGVNQNPWAFILFVVLTVRAQCVGNATAFRHRPKF